MPDTDDGMLRGATRAYAVTIFSPYITLMLRHYIRR